ncbi:MAG: LuxR C-terminal-related transcriptional regulator, partial [Candidatus Omnitrophica bacterium]|nr:LuxR C-terminal-related transcriptional regulator [Candidatus Omnitrophota bacterium]
KREFQILKLVAQGLSNKNIASKLKLSIRTVEAHRSNLTHKLGIKNTANLVKYAISKQLI